MVVSLRRRATSRETVRHFPSSDMLRPRPQKALFPLLPLIHAAASGALRQVRSTVSVGLLLSAVSAFGQAVPEQGFTGQGAALCVAAGEILSAQPRAAASIREGVLAWRQVLHVIEGTEVQRQAALEQARASLTATSDADVRRSTRMAQMTWSVACATRDMQIRYIAVHGSKDRTQNNLAEEPGSQLPAETADLLNFSALCFAGAEFFLQPKLSPPLRTTFKEAAPPIPNVAVLRRVQDETRKVIDASVGSVVGKSLVVDYYRFLYSSASTGTAPQSFVNQASARLNERCLTAVENRE